MYTDLNGAKRLKVNLHLHTTGSDGCKTPEEAAAIYRAAGYDVIAVTDHWRYRASGELGGLRILGGAEYNIGGGDSNSTDAIAWVAGRISALMDAGAKGAFIYGTDDRASGWNASVRHSSRPRPSPYRQPSNPSSKPMHLLLKQKRRR